MCLKQSRTAWPLQQLVLCFHLNLSQSELLRPLKHLHCSSFLFLHPNEIPSIILIIRVSDALMLQLFNTSPHVLPSWALPNHKLTFILTS